MNRLDLIRDRAGAVIERPIATADLDERPVERETRPPWIPTSRRTRRCRHVLRPTSAPCSLCAGIVVERARVEAGSPRRDSWQQTQAKRRRARNDQMCPEGHITLEQFAERVGLAHATITNYAANGRIASTMINGWRFVPEAEVDRFKASRPGTNAVQMGSPCPGAPIPTSGDLRQENS